MQNLASTRRFKILAMVLFFGLLAIPLIASAHIEQVVCTADLSTPGSPLDCGGKSIAGCQFVSFIGDQVTFNCEVPDAPQKPETTITNISEVQKNDPNVWVEHWAGGNTMLVVVQPNGNWWYFNVDTDGTVNGGHVAQWADGKFSWTHS